MNSKGDELVLGLPRDAVPGGLEWRGVQGLPHAPLLAALDQHGTYRRRGDAEDDPTWKQVIPYLALRDGGDIFLMRRTRAGGDARRHRQRGHRPPTSTRTHGSSPLLSTATPVKGTP